MIRTRNSLKADFFRMDTVAVARNLIGCMLYCEGSRDGEAAPAGLIVETEAYLADDPASHSFRGPTKRNRSMFQAAGTVYVYRIYGIHHCVNIVTAPPGIGEAVLIRAIEPISGLAEMWARRFGTEIPPEILDGDSDGWARRGTAVPIEWRNLTNGPGKLCSAFGIEVAGWDGRRVDDGPLRIRPGRSIDERDIVTGCRVGLAPGRGDGAPLRFSLNGSPFLSRPPG